MASGIQEENERENGNELSPLERELYACMQARAGTVISRDELLKTVWGFQTPGMTRTVDMCVRRLRGKIGTERIRSVYGKGYMLVRY